MPTFLAYARRSLIDPRHRKAIESTDQQQSRIDAWARLEGATVEHFVEPEGHRSGGSIAHRPAYQALLERLRTSSKGTIAGVVVTDLDRSGRNERDLHALFEALASRGLRFVVLDDPAVDLASSDGRFWAGLKALLAAQERRKGSERAKRSIAFRQAAGIFHGALPLGYQRGVIEVDGRPQKTIVPDPDEAAVVQAILARYLEDDVGIYQLCAWCHTQGFRTKRGAYFQPHTLITLLQHVELYAGYVVQHQDGDRRPSNLIPGQHQAIVSEDMARQVRQKLTARRRSGGRPPANVYPLRGLVWCGTCGGKLAGRSPASGGVVYRYYTCYRAAGPCTQRSIRAETAEGAVWDVLLRLGERLYGLTPFLELPDAPPARARPRADDPRTIAGEIARLDELYLKGRLTSAVYEARRAELEARQAAAEAAQADAADVPPLALEQVARWLQDLRADLLADDRPALQARAQALVERVTVTGDQVDVQLIGPLAALHALDKTV